MDFIRNYIANLQKALSGIDPTRIDQAIRWIREAGENGKFVYSCGNGGSASIASQMVVDMLKCASEGRDHRFRMIGLTDSIPTVTALANDIAYEHVFDEQLRNFAGRGDVLIAISGSGNSPNVLRAVEYARSVGCRTIALTTDAGGRLKDLADLSLTVPSRHMGNLEDCFFVMTHIIVYAFTEKAY